jgi:hypothetical protein
MKDPPVFRALFLSFVERSVAMRIRRTAIAQGFIESTKAAPVMTGRVGARLIGLGI